MRLRKLELTNFRAFATEEFYFSDRVTVIAGINGRGKSSILDGLSLLLSRLLPQVTPAKGGYKYLQPKDIYQCGPSTRLSLAVSFEDIPIDYTIDYGLDEGQRPTKLLPQVRREIRRIYGNPQREGDAAPIAVHYTTDRAAYRLPKRLLPSITQDQSAAYHGALSNRQVDFREFMSRLAAWASLIERNEDPHGLNQRTIDVLNRAVGIFLPGFSNIRVLSEPLQLIAKKQGQDINLIQMSDGERALFAMVIDLCRRLTLANPELPDPLQGAGVVLIDEIELHLHPTWQREIVEKLRATFPRVQFVLTTHSPFVIQSAHSGSELILLDAQPLDQLENKGIEEISKAVMGVDRPDVGERYEAMKAVARSYLERLNEAPIAPEEKLAQFKEELARSIAPFADNPAFQAFLEMKRAARLGE